MSLIVADAFLAERAKRRVRAFARANSASKALEGIVNREFMSHRARSSTHERERYLEFFEQSVKTGGNLDTEDHHQSDVSESSIYLSNGVW